MIVLLLSGEVALRLGCFLSMIMTVGIAAWRVWNTSQEGIRYLKRLHQVPCSRCVYFTGDHRLKCPVHPIIALTEEAIACRDYEAREIPLYPLPPNPVPKLAVSKPAFVSSISRSSISPPCLKTVIPASIDRTQS